MKRTIAVYKWK